MIRFCHLRRIRWADKSPETPHNGKRDPQMVGTAFSKKYSFDPTEFVSYFLLYFLLMPKESTKEKAAKSKNYSSKLKFRPAIWHWEIPPRLDNLEPKLSANFEDPGRWFFRRETLFKEKNSFRRKKGGVRFL
jgi:hypothetical protein